MNKNKFIFIVWGSASKYLHKIEKSLTSKFLILNKVEIRWDEKLFTNNLFRFYFRNLINENIKIIETGTDNFYLYVVIDKSPVYKNYKIRNSIEYINENIYLEKLKLRKMTGGGHRIHSSNTYSETQENLLILGVNEEINKKYIYQNIPGAISWNNLKEAFKFLENFNKYVILRDFDSIEEKFKNGLLQDIDILVDNKKIAVKILNATKISKLPYKSNYQINVDNKSINIDIRDINDNYYPKPWAEAILNTRVKKTGFYVPNKENYNYSILYHALVHKYEIPKKYKHLIIKSRIYAFKKLGKFLKDNSYNFSEPDDLSVAFSGNKNSLKRKIYLCIKFFVTLINKFSTNKMKKINAFFKKKY
jgi:hypothetical protein